MNTRTRIGLIVLITAALVLAVVIPALARKPIETDENCYVSMPIIHKDGKTYAFTNIYGALDAYWEAGTLYNFCTGIIPWGEELDIPAWRLLTFNETSDYFSDFIICEQSYCYTNPDLWFTITHQIYDPVDGITYGTEVWEVTIYRNGEFLFYKEYTPEE